MKQTSLCPSILSADFARLAEDVSNVLEAGADCLHVDIMDNHFVPNLSFGPMICKALRRAGISAPLDVHIMAKPVDRLIEMSIEAGASQISIHPEGSEDLAHSLSLIKNAKLKAGLALNPGTSIDCLSEVSHFLDFILVMLVNPGFGGQTADLKQIEKIKELRKCHPDKEIQVDGGVNLENIKSLFQAGATSFVAGSAIFNQENYQATIEQFKSQLV
jgi:ribulose-phosphate 3-epimerase